MNTNCYFIPLGGGQQVGASCYFLKLGHTNILLDCGIGYNNGLIFEPNLRFLQQSHFIESLSQITHVFISHAHMDHVGNLPFLMKTIPETPIFMTETTKDLVRYQLYNKNFYQHFVREGKEAERLALQYLFDNKIVHVSYLQTLSFTTYKASFYAAGHIPGAMMILFEYKGKNILYTGDYSVDATPLTQGCILPNKPIDTLILCSLHAKHSATHGTQHNTSNRKTQGLHTVLYDIMNLLYKGKSVHCHIKQLSKGIEFLELLNSSISKGVFPDVPIYIDSAIFTIVEHIEKSLKPLIQKNVHSAALLYKNRQPCICISTHFKSRFGFEYRMIDFSLHDDYDKTVRFIRKINPKEAFIVHTADTDMYEGEEALEAGLLQDADCRTHCIFAENEEIYQLA